MPECITCVAQPHPFTPYYGVMHQVFRNRDNDTPSSCVAITQVGEGTYGLSLLPPPRRGAASAARLPWEKALDAYGAPSTATGIPLVSAR